jgi:hypothetical protein
VKPYKNPTTDVLHKPDNLICYLQAAEIERIRKANTKWIILGDIAIDGRDDLRFCNTHPMIWKFIQGAYRPVPVEGLPPRYTIYVKNPTP